MTATRPEELPFSGDPEADALLASDPMALLIGFVLDQQVTVQKAFGSPLELQKRIGTLDAATIAGMDPGDLEEAFRTRPALHRFPGNMARRTQALCAVVAETYAGDATRIWTEAADGPDLQERLLGLPGIGEMKARALLAILGRRLALELDGLDDVMPDYPTLADVDSAEALKAYQEKKRAYKRKLKAEGGSFDPSDMGMSKDR
ncbi:MAG: HhH-GPD-type base excision DNA repair protein [Chloroflexota bacterium]|nr:HhH-GPD-type base excision DNA repair protein [Chloroflexota bacterium]